MNKKIAVIILIFLAILLAGISRSSQKNEIFSIPSTTPNPFTNSIDIDYQNQKITASWFEMDSSQNISLIPNFNEKENASEIFTKNNCVNLINGGFYSPENSPIGLFISNDKKMSNYQNNLLFNGFLKFKENKGLITADPQVDNFDIILQTGPIVYRNGKEAELSIKNDTYDRRMVAAVSPSKVVFISFYDKTSIFNGPHLNDLPNLVGQFSRLTKSKIIDAINLDGGSASAFYTTNFALSEITPIGSAFCVKAN